MAFLSIQEAQKRYNNSIALDRISLDVARGELVALLGPSGSGKSTLLMAVAGFVALDHGDIVLDGASIRHLQPYKRNFGVVFQQYALFPHLTVEQNVAYPLRIRGMSRAARDAAVTRSLERVQLVNFRKRVPAELSGGQQQRVALARALSFEPALLLMDEPLGALDRKLRIEMQREIREIQQELGITTLYVTHDQDEAMSMADHIAVVNQGKIEQIARPLEIYDRPASEFVANFIGEANLLRGSVSAVQSGEAAIVTNTGCSILVDERSLNRGQPVTVVLRPEHIALGHDAGEASRGVVRQCSYFGSNIRCVVDFQGQSLISVVPRRDLSFEPSPGMNVAVSWPRSAARVLSPETAIADHRPS